MDSFLFQRQLYGSDSRRLSRVSKGCKRDLEASMMSRLGSTKTLEGHNGCVNTLRWNNDGTLLASGSDDRTVCIWDICGQKRTQHQTNHDGNIFGVEFVPYGEDRIVATCAGDHMIKLHDIVQNEELHSFNADGRVKRLATAQDEPHLFWSAGEDGFVREHDVRDNKVRIIIKAPHGRYAKTMAICQGRTEMLAVGLGVYYIPVYDRRMSIEGKAKIMLRCGPADNTTKSPRNQCLYSTHVAFDYPGRKLIANQSGGITGGSVFVYNLTESTNPVPTVQKLMRILDGSIETLEKDGPIELDPQLIALKNEAKQLLDAPGRKFYKIIRLYTECLSRDFQMSTEQRSILYGNRSITYLLHNQQGDVYAALRDAIESLTLNPNYSKSYWRMVKALVTLKQRKLAEECIEFFKRRFPASPDLRTLEKVLNEDKDKKEPNDDVDDLRSVTQPMIDYESRFTGHRNLQTDIKEANFFGSHNQYIISGSDDGCLFVWDRHSGLINALFSADEDICNIVQPHPDKFLIATSGIEHSIRFWEPLAEGEEEPRRRKVDDLVQSSQWEHFMYLQAMMHLQRHAEQDEEIESDDD